MRLKLYVFPMIILLIILCSKYTENNSVLSDNKPNVKIQIRNGFPLVFVPLCGELNITIESPDDELGLRYYKESLMYKEIVSCKSGENFSIEAYVTKWTGINMEAEYKIIVNGYNYFIKASEPQSEITGDLVAFFESGNLPAVVLSCPGKFESNALFSYSEKGIRQVSQHQLECEGRKYIIEYSNYTYTSYKSLKGFSAHLSFKHPYP